MNSTINNSFKNMNINGNRTELNHGTNGTSEDQNRSENEWVKLNVGGCIYRTTKSTLCRFPDSFLARLCHDNNALKSQKDGEDAILIDRDGEYFSVVLNFLRHGNIILNKNLVEEGVLEEAEFYNIPELVKMCEKRIQARQQQDKKPKPKPVYRFIQCCENEIVSVISGLSDGWRFEQLLLNKTPNQNNGSETEFFCVVSSDSANYCGSISHKAKSRNKTDQLRQLGLEKSSKLRHRGPDWSGIHLQEYRNENGDLLINVLAHERLAIIDPANGAQPLFSQDGTCCLSVNGEIWNHRDIRSHFDNKYQFSTGSDCEVIIPLYLNNKSIDEFLKKLDGIFAFVLSDNKEKVQIAARDPIGVMPLYIGWSPEGEVWLASELKAICGNCVHIREFPPGHYWSSKTNEFVRYYDSSWWPLSDKQQVNGDWPLAPKEYKKLDFKILRDKLERSVVKRLMCDVPYGVLLSGGLDSSLIASIVNRHAAKRVEENEKSDAWFPKLHTFSIGLKGSPDLLSAKKVSDFLGTIHHEFHFTVQQGIDAISDVIYNIETYDITTIRASTPMFLLSRIIKASGIKMVLSGEGADEIFGGYLYFHKAPTPKDFQLEICDKLRALSKYDCLRANKSSSAWGVEVRVPFLDLDFLDYAAAIDPAEKMIVHPITKERRIEKFILRKAFDSKENPYLPDEVLWRQKEQFSDGVGYSWIDGLKEYAEKQITNSQMSNASLVFPDNTPTSKEAYLYRCIFHKHFPQESSARTVPGGPSIACSTARAFEWDQQWAKMNDPSGRAVAGVHQDAYF